MINAYINGQRNSFLLKNCEIKEKQRDCMYKQKLNKQRM